MDLNRYTEKAQHAILGAQGLAEKMGHPQLEPEHLLASLVEQRDGIVPEVLRKMGVDPARVSTDLQAELEKRPHAYGGAQPGVSPRLAAVARMAEGEAEHLKDEYVSTEHLIHRARRRG